MVKLSMIYVQNDSKMVLVEFEPNPSKMTLLSVIKTQLRHQEINLVMFLAGLALFRIPLQHYFTLARYQHYGICLAVWAMGFVFQVIWSWKSLTKLGRASLLSTGIYLAAFALVFYYSPWLDTRMAVQTEEQDIQRICYATIGALFGGFTVLLWLFWLFERKDSERTQTPKEKEN